MSPPFPSHQSRFFYTRLVLIFVHIFIKMGKEEILQLVELFNLETYNVNDKCFCIKGINGDATIVYYAGDPITTIKRHLIQMGRDSLKMDLNCLLDITKHN